MMAGQQTTKAQIQKGTDIDGEAAGDCSGISVCMPDPATIAIGAPYNDGSGSDAGHVRIYSWVGSDWVQKGLDLDGEAAGDVSGWVVSMPDSNTVAIGAYSNDAIGSNAGHVRIYSWDGSAWVQKGSDIDGEAAGDQSGIFVSMPDAETIGIGAIFNDGSGSNAGHVRIYSWDGSDWEQKGSDIDGEAEEDMSGRCVSMPDANTVAIGAYGNDDSGISAGHVRIYSWSGSVWTQKGIDIDGEAAGDFSGYFASMPDANTVAIGASYNFGSGVNSGHVRIYSWDGSAWVQKGIDIDGEAAGDESGISVNMPDANTVAIGAVGNSDNGAYAGHVRIYTWDGSAWVQKGIDIDGEAAYDYSGWSVHMPDVNTVAIGAWFNDDSGIDAGNVRVYTFCTNTASSISPFACSSYTSPSGNYTWTASGTYQDTIANAAGCDSVITINLTVYSIDTSVVNTSPVLTANESGAAYQWVDCNNAFAVIPGATNQSYTATANGSYAVIITKGGCTDTSACHTVTTVGIVENSFDNIISLYPNPTNGQFEIAFSEYIQDATVVVRNALGQEVLSREYDSTIQIQLNIDGAPGFYFVEIANAGNKAVLKVVKE